MKVFGKENNMGNKSLNIIRLYKNNFIIPKTLILEKREIDNFNISLLKNNKKYILRPSFNLEDEQIKVMLDFLIV